LLVLQTLKLYLDGMKVPYATGTVCSRWCFLFRFISHKTYNNSNTRQYLRLVPTKATQLNTVDKNPKTIYFEEVIVKKFE